MSLPTLSASCLKRFETTLSNSSARICSSGLSGLHKFVKSSIVANGVMFTPPLFESFRDFFDHHCFRVFFVNFNIMFFRKLNQLSFCHFFKVNFFFDVFFCCFFNYLLYVLFFVLVNFHPIFSNNFKGAIHNSPCFSVFVFQLTSPFNLLLPLAQRCTMLLLP